MHVAIIIIAGGRRENTKAYYFNLRRKNEKFWFGKECDLVNLLLFCLANNHYAY